MGNYYFVYFILMTGYIFGTPQQPPYISIIDALAPFIGDEECVKKARQDINEAFQKLIKEQNDLGTRIQNILNAYESPTKHLFIEWQNREDQKTKIVTQNLHNVLNCSSVYRTGKTIAAVPGQIAQKAQDAAQATKDAVARAKQATKNAATRAGDAAKIGATIAIGVPIVAGQAAYRAGEKTVTATVNAAEQAKKAAQEKISQTKEAIIEQKDSYLKSFIKWLSRGISTKNNP